MRTPIALLASTALLLPAAVLASPAQAVSEATTATITNCQKTKFGVTVRIKIRDEGRFSRIRVSHPRGDGRFLEPRVRSVRAVVLNYGRSGPGAIGFERKDPASPSFRNRPPSKEFGTEVVAKFRLRNGKSVGLSCTMR